MEELTIISPPDSTFFSNLSKEGPFMIKAVVPAEKAGTATGSLLMQTLAFAVPPRTSAPYEGIQVT